MRTAAKYGSHLSWRDLSSRAVSGQVLWAQVSLTAVFGMGTGGPSPQSAPTGASRSDARDKKQEVRGKNGGVSLKIYLLLEPSQEARSKM